jgi:hypothetical protein
MKRWTLTGKRRFCNDGCKTGLREDRRAGLIYPPFAVPVADIPQGMGSFPLPGLPDLRGVSWEDGAALSRTCAYCGADLARKR